MDGGCHDHGNAAPGVQIIPGMAIEQNLNVVAYGSVILDKGFEDWAKTSRKGWLAVHIEPGFVFGRR